MHTHTHKTIQRGFPPWFSDVVFHEVYCSSLGVSFIPAPALLYVTVAPVTLQL